MLVNDPSRDGRRPPTCRSAGSSRWKTRGCCASATTRTVVSGRHDAAKVLAPYIEGIIARDRSVARVAVVLLDTRSANKITQTLLEMVRGGIREFRIDLTVLHGEMTTSIVAFVDHLGFRGRRLSPIDELR